MGFWIFGDGNDGTAHWEPDPGNGRGTWTVLSSCIITLTLCVYSSLHLNIPAHKTSTASTFAMKAKYVVFGLLAPEVIAYNAWRQRTVASSITAQLRTARGGKKDRSWSQFKTVSQRMLQGITSWSCRLVRCLKEKQNEVIFKLFQCHGHDNRCILINPGRAEVSACCWC